MSTGHKNRKSKSTSGNGKKGQICRFKENAVQQRPLYSHIALLGILIAVVGLIVLTVHWPALSARAISIDDGQYLGDNRLVQNPGWSSAGRFLTEVLNPSTVGGYYQPFSMISLMLDYSAGGRVDNLMPFHRTSLVLHVFNTGLIIVLLYLLFGQPWIAAVVGLLFGIHPMTVEPIPWISERKTLLAAFFALLSLITYVLYTRKSGRKYLYASLMMYVLALMSKPTSTPLPVLMLLLDYWPVKRLSWKTVLEKVPFLVIGFISAIITFFSQSNEGGVALPQAYSLLRIPLVICHNIVFYLYKIIWPVNLTSHYPVPDPLTLSHPAVLAGVIGTCLLIPALLVSLRWTRALLAGWLFFFIAVFPAMGVIGFTFVIASDKYAYLPSVGLLLTLAWLMGRIWNKISGSQKIAPGHAALIAAVLILSVSEITATRNYLVYWQNSQTLFRHMLSLDPESSTLNYHLGFVLYEQGQADEAILHFRKAISADPDYAEAHNYLAVALFKTGKSDEAISHYKEAIRIDPNYAGVYYNLGNALYSKGKLGEAISCYRQEILINPENFRAHYNLGNALFFQGKPDEAITEFNEVIRLDPNNTEAYNNIGIVLASQGKPDEAVEVFHKVLQIQPLDADAHKYLEKILAERGKFDEAINEYRSKTDLP